MVFNTVFPRTKTLSAVEALTKFVLTFAIKVKENTAIENAKTFLLSS